MPQIPTLPVPDKYELDQALKNQKKAAKDKKRDTHLGNLGNLLSRIPPLPQYQPMEIEDRAAVSHLPEDIFLTPYTVFSLIWTTTVWDMLCKNTNLYAAAQNTLKSVWKPTDVSELKIFVAITIYMGIFHFPTIHDYWRTDGVAPVASIFIGLMTRDRYIILRRHIHCSDPDNEDTTTIGTGRWKQPVWYKKLVPFTNEIRKNWKNLRTPGSHTSIDECMIKETGRTHHSTIMQNKPIKEGYKLFAIGDEGYLYNYS